MSDDGLDIIDPPTRQVMFRGERLELRPLTIGQLPAFSRLVRPVIAEFVGDRHPHWQDDDALMVLDLQDLHGEAIIQAAALASGLPVERVAGAEEISDLLRLVYAIVEVNRDFFIRMMRAELVAHRRAAEVEQPAQTGGPMPSSTSSEPVTA